MIVLDERDRVAAIAVREVVRAAVAERAADLVARPLLLLFRGAVQRQMEVSRGCVGQRSLQFLAVIIEDQIGIQSREAANRAKIGRTCIMTPPEKQVIRVLGF